ncbi:hypothetical protein H7Y21_02990 [Arenimonas sp.]|nr:hypothetical protein [Candidatus Parcubacteria bacterium]
MEIIPFDVPQGSTIVSTYDSIPFLRSHLKELTDENFATELPKGPVAGNFLEMKKKFKTEDGIKAIRALAEKHGRNFRPGTPLEMLLFKKQHINLCPEHIVIVVEGRNKLFLFWERNGYSCFGKSWLDNPSKFNFCNNESCFDERFRVFLVEDL